MIQVCIWLPPAQTPVILEKRYTKMNVKMLLFTFRQIRGIIYKSVTEAVVLMDHGDKCHWDVLFKVEEIELLITKLQVTLVQDAFTRFIN